MCYLTRYDYPSLVEGESHGILCFDKYVEPAAGYSRIAGVPQLQLLPCPRITAEPLLCQCATAELLLYQCATTTAGAVPVRHSSIDRIVDTAPRCDTAAETVWWIPHRGVTQMQRLSGRYGTEV